ncbi:MAG: DsbE family thiol:disulfide interchange protein [Alphaproteobacteria bacterium]
MKIKSPLLIRFFKDFMPLMIFGMMGLYFAVQLVMIPELLPTPTALKNRPVPAISLPLLDSEEKLDEKKLGEGAVIIHFFASWCAPCRAEQPMLLQLAYQHQRPIIGIAYKDTPENIRKYLQETGNPYTKVALDENGLTGIDFGINGVPELYVVDAAGLIRYRYVGPLTKAIMVEKILPLMNGETVQ